MKQIKKIKIALISLGLIGTQVYAQTSPIEGQIIDAENQQILMGVNVITSDTSVTEVSNLEGRFNIRPKTESGTLHFSSLGYQSKTITFDEHTRNLKVELLPEDIALGEVVVQAFNSYKKNKDIPAAVAVLNKSQLDQGNGVSLQSALNSVPGVKMDQSKPGDARLSIRGSGVRAPWAIRNLKMYINDIPVTQTDGTTRLESINLGDLDHIEIIKGPASSVYGGGSIGGVINMNYKRAQSGENSITANGLIGAHGLKRIAGIYQSGAEKVNSYISYGFMEYDGYREHSSDIRRFINGNFQFYPSKKQTLTLLLSRTSEDTQIPGALTKEQWEENPKQADPDNVAQGAGRYQTWTRIGLGQSYNFNEYFSNTSSVFTYFYDLDHPLSYAYLRSLYQSFGGRTNFVYDPKWKQQNTRFMIGGEFNQAKEKGTQYQNNAGVEGEISSNTDNKNTYYTMFFQAETALTNRLMLTLGGSYNGLRYDLTDYMNPSKTGVKNFKGQFAPRAALSYDFGRSLSLHASISDGFAPPTSGEISLPNGSINQNLNAEKALNYEIDAKGSFFKARLNYDFSVYVLKMKNELIEQTVGQNVSVYHNSGKSTHAGAELATSYQLIRKSDKRWVKELKPYVALTYARYRFDDYKILDDDNQLQEDFKDKDLPGIAPWMMYAGVDVKTEPGFYFNANFYFNDKAPLNNANTAYNDAYRLVDAKFGYQSTINRHFEIDIYAGVNNMMNERYSSYTSLNAVAWGGGSPAYFQPSPGRSGYVGLNLKYTL